MNCIAGYCLNFSFKTIIFVYVMVISKDVAMVRASVRHRIIVS